MPILLAAMLLAGCGRGRRVLEVNYVSASQVNLRDRVAAVYNKTGTAKNGAEAEIVPCPQMRSNTASALPPFCSYVEFAP